MLERQRQGIILDIHIHVCGDPHVMKLDIVVISLIHIMVVIRPFVSLHIKHVLYTPGNLRFYINGAISSFFLQVSNSY